MHPDEGALPLDLYALGRGLAYWAELALIGACVFAALVPRWRDEADDDQSLAARALAGSWRIAVLAGAVLILAHLLRAYGQVRSFLDPGEPFNWETARTMIVGTTWGHGWSWQVAAALLSLPLALLAPRRPATGLALLGTAAIAVAATSPLTGHAREHPWGPGLGIGLHTLHLLGGGLWLGTLFALVTAGLSATTGRAGDHAAIARMVGRFSPIALAGAALAATAGLLLAVAYVGEFGALWGTTYGRTLLVKVGCLTGAAALGAWNWRRVRPRLGTPTATAELRRSATLELILGFCLLAATAVLVALPAPKL